jgi:hypothetical protein
MPGYHAEVSEPGAGSPTARRSFATLDGALDWVMWRKVDNPDLIGRIVTDDPITLHRRAMARLHRVDLETSAPVEELPSALPTHS